ncbi:MAG: cupredoxin domain-containing protein [Actinomycetota bacterium]|nr:cupredoxin domain-containing protein [Actinomycetota bacterium]
MSRARASVGVALALAVAAAAGPAAADDPLGVKGTSVGVSEREFRISPYRRTVPTGTVKFNVRNYGEDVHDLVVLSPGGRTLGTTGEIGAGEGSVLRLKLRKAGVYRLVCTQADHAARGMKSRITVRATRR